MFDPNRLTAAHRTLPFGTRLRVVNQVNGRSVVVRINDRGPSTRTSVLNLSRGSARALGITGTGLVAFAALPGWLRHPLSGRDPQEGDDDDTDDSFWWGRSGPGWADVAPAQARCGPAPVAG